MARWLRNIFGSDARDAPPAPAPGADERIATWMREAYALHDANKLGEAEDRYRWILREQPDNVDALFLLGEIANRTGRHARAIELIGQAIAAKGDVAAFHRELAGAQRANRELAAAARSLARVLELEPGDLQCRVDMGVLQLEQRDGVAAEKTFRDILRDGPGLLVAHVNLGAALSAQRRYAEAEACFQEAIRIDPFCSQAFSNLGILAIKKGDLAEGRRLVDRALQIDPLCFEAKINLSTILMKQHKWDEAVEILEDAVRAEPGRPEVHANVGKLHLFLGRHDEAMEALQNALRLDPASVDAHLEMGKALFDTGKVEESIEHLRAAAALDPSLSIAHLDLGHVLDAKGDADGAMACYERALALDPNDVQAHVSRSAIWLRTGDFERGWPEYEWRLRTKNLVDYYQRFSFPRWDGTPLDGRTLLVYSEQGIGDEIMYASCFPELLAQRGHCVIECAAKLETLFRRSFPQATVLAETKDDPEGWLKQVPPVDVAIPAASLPLYLRRSASAFPRDRAFLRADPGRVDDWRERLGGLGAGLKVGVSWRGGVAKTNAALRSLSLERLLPVLRTPGVRFVNLQYGDSQGERDRLQYQHGVILHHWQQAIDDYEETAALVSALDLTISVCTAVIHLNGALARPVWIMAPVRPEARYGFEGGTMPWYGSARMFRQPAFGDWGSVISNVAQALQAFAR